MDDVQGALADSPAADSIGTPDATSAATQNTDQAPPVAETEKPTPFHLHPRWQQMVANNRALQARLAELERRATAQAQPPAPTPSEDEEKAARALMGLMGKHPQLKALLDLAGHAPKLMEGYQGVQQLNRMQAVNTVQQGRSQIASFVKDAGLPADERSVAHIEELVAGAIRRLPNGEARFKRGDLGVVREAFQDVQQTFLAALRRPTTANVAATKARVTNLPPAPRGGLPGPSAPPKLEDGKEREFLRSLHNRAAAVIAGSEG